MEYVKKDRGFSLVELMASMVVMAIISVNLATMVKNQDAATFKTMAEYDMAQATTEIGSFLASNTNCTTFMNGVTPSASPNVVSSSATVPGITSIVTKNLPVALSKFIASNNGDKSTAVFFGNSGTGIHSFVLSDWIANSTTHKDEPAVLQINFFKKGSSSTSIVTKSINLFLDTSGSITSCRAIGFIDKVSMGGISNCPVSMVMIGAPGGRGTYCISKAAEAAASFSSAVGACSPSGVSIYNDSKLGTAHLCDFSEWSQACLSNEAAPITGFTIADGVAEWISSAPVTTATVSPPDAVTAESKVMQIGEAVSTFEKCLTTKSVLPAVNNRYRCCFH